MHSFQNFIVRLIPNHPPPLETRIWKLVVRALQKLFYVINIQLRIQIIYALISIYHHRVYIQRIILNENQYKITKGGFLIGSHVLSQ